jgi:hypothetical protein
MKPANLRLHSSASRLTSRACGQVGRSHHTSLTPGSLSLEPADGAGCGERKERQAGERLRGGLSRVRVVQARSVPLPSGSARVAQLLSGQCQGQPL